MRFSVDAWDPSYGTSSDLTPDETSSADVVLDLEAGVNSWGPIYVAASLAADEVAFIDGVRRVDARVWIEHEGTVDPGICASYAAGAMLCNNKAQVETIEVRRGVFSASPEIAEIETNIGWYGVRKAAASTPEMLSLELQTKMTEVEMGVAALATGLAGLTVIDGPLRHSSYHPTVVGFVKTHNTHYLADEFDRTIGKLDAGQRTPIFLIGGRFTRHSWYLRLPGPSSSPWAGIVRCEASAELATPAVIELANTVSATLPKYSSEPHKDSRAPQNLYPIAALERELRRRLGDQRIVYRALRVAAMSAVGV